MSIQLEMKIKEYGTVVLELYPEYAFNSVASIVEMARQGCYRDLAIQRIAPDFVLQPWYDEERMDDRYQYEMELEIEHNPLMYNKYAIGMAGDGKTFASCGCFFITLADCWQERLNQHFTPVGYVVAGKEVIERIVHLPLKDVETEMKDVIVKEPIIPVIIEDIKELSPYELVEVKKWKRI